MIEEHIKLRTLGNSNPAVSDITVGSFASEEDLDYMRAPSPAITPSDDSSISLPAHLLPFRLQDSSTDEESDDYERSVYDDNRNHLHDNVVHDEDNHHDNVSIDYEDSDGNPVQVEVANSQDSHHDHVSNNNDDREQNHDPDDDGNSLSTCFGCSFVTRCLQTIKFPYCMSNN